MKHEDIQWYKDTLFEYDVHEGISHEGGTYHEVENAFKAAKEYAEHQAAPLEARIVELEAALKEYYDAHNRLYTISVGKRPDEVSIDPHPLLKE